MRAAWMRPDEGRGPTGMEAGRPPGPGAGAARAPGADRPGTGGPGGGPGPRGIEADPAEGEPRNAGGPWPTPERAGRRPARRGETLLSPFTPRRLTFRGRRAP